MASFLGNRGFGSGIFRPVILVASVCLLMFLLYAYSSTNSELKQHKDRGDRLARQQEMLKTQVKDLLDARNKLEKDLQKMEAEQTRCIRDTEQLKKTYTSQIESMKETLKFRISSLENENSELQSRAGSYEEKYNELIASRKKDQDLHATAQQKCHEATQKLEAQNAELNVQMTDMQHNLDTFRLDRLRSESLRQNCSNQLTMSRMKFGQLQEEFQQMSSKLKAMGNAFNDNQPAVQDKQVSISEATKTPSSQMRVLHTDKPDTTDRHMVKKNVLSALEKKLAQGEKLEDSEQMLYQALAREAGKVMDLKQMNKKQDSKDASEWVKNLPAEHTRSISKEAQDLLNKQLNKPGNNIPAPPFVDEYKDMQQQQRKQQPNLVLPKLHLDDKLDLNEKPAAVDEQKTFEQDQRDEERRLFEMFQGDNNHNKDEFKDGLKDDGDERLAQNNELYDDKEDEEDDEDDDDDDDDNNGGDNYKDKDDNYVYGGQDHKVNPDMQSNNALI